MEGGGYLGGGRRAAPVQTLFSGSEVAGDAPDAAGRGCRMGDAQEDTEVNRGQSVPCTGSGGLPPPAGPCRAPAFPRLCKAPPGRGKGLVQVLAPPPSPAPVKQPCREPLALL